MTMISIIVPTRNRLNDLTNCLQGLALQDSLSLVSEVIVIDDYSEKPYGETVRTLCTQLELPLIYDSNRLAPGVASARNYGASYVRGDVIAFLDDDAIPASNWLRVISDTFREHSVSAITGRILPLDGEKLFSRSRQLRYELRQRAALTHHGDAHFLTAGNAAIRKSDFDQLGGFDVTFEVMHDRELALRLTSMGKRCIYVHELVIKHRNNKGVIAAYRQSFASAYYRMKLEQLYPEVTPWSVAEQWKTFSVFLKAMLADNSQLLPALVTCTTELVHACGCCWYRVLAR